MLNSDTNAIHYKRARFSTHLPMDRLYTPSHFWLQEDSAGSWKVGFTKFATRMLGEILECRFEVKPNAEVAIGQVIGFVEAFKAVSDLYSVIQGTFKEINPQLLQDYGVVSSSPYHRAGYTVGNSDRYLKVQNYKLLTERSTGCRNAESR